MICPHGFDEGMVERQATPDEVDNGCELGIAFDPCPECASVSATALYLPEDVHLVVLIEPDFEPDLSTCPYYRRGLPGFDPKGVCSFGCSEEPSCITDRPVGGWPGDARLVP